MLASPPRILLLATLFNLTHLLLDSFQVGFARLSSWFIWLQYCSRFVFDFTRDYHLNDQRFEMIWDISWKFGESRDNVFSSCLHEITSCSEGKRDIPIQKEETLPLPNYLIMKTLEGVHGGWLCCYVFTTKKSRQRRALNTSSVRTLRISNMIKKLYIRS